MYFAAIVLIPGLIFTILLLERGSILPFSDGEYSIADSYPADSGHTEALFNLSSDGRQIRCGNEVAVNISLECPGTDSNITSGAFETFESDEILCVLG